MLKSFNKLCFRLLQPVLMKQQFSPPCPVYDFHPKQYIYWSLSSTDEKVFVEILMVETFFLQHFQLLFVIKL